MSLRPALARFLLPLLLALVGPASGAFARDLVPVPVLAARVTDLTGALADAERQALEQTLAAFEQRKGSQIAVLIVPSTAPETIEQYAMRVAESWRLGRKGVDDGALLLIARDDRRLRIEVGYGLEGAVPDIAAKRIVSDIIGPRLRAGDFHGGVRTGVDALIGLVDGEPLPEPERDMARGRPSGVMNLLPVLIMVVLVAGAVLRSLFGRLGGAATTGVLIGGIVWFALGVLGVAFVAALVAFVFTVGGGASSGWSSRHGGGFGGGFGGMGGGGFGGGGFGGGGGRFGGGGASGGW
jgi:uncharacterized protein